MDASWQSKLSYGLGLTVAASLIGTLIFGLSTHPAFAAALAILLTGYGVILLKWERAWILTLPLLLPILDFTAWSGRLFINAFDFLILVTLAAQYARMGFYRALPNLLSSAGPVFLILFISYAVSTAIFLLPLDNPDVNQFTSYLSRYNSLRVAKGFFWAWLLMPGLEAAWRRDAGAVVRLLLSGLTLGLTVAGLVFLWERGIFDALVHWRGFYAFGAVLLDFTSSYRAVGWFPEMHVGGTTTDGYLALVLPFMLAAFLIRSHTPARVLISVAIILGGYAALVTFSRGLYGALIMSVLTAMLLGAWYKRDSLAANLPKVTALLLGFGALFALMVAGFQGGGTQVLFFQILILWAGIAGGYVLGRFPAAAVIPIYGVFLLGAGYGMFDGFNDSRWTDIKGRDALVATFVIIALFGALSFGAGALVLKRIHTASLALGLLAASILAGGMVMAGFGSRMTLRFATSTEDLASRQHHWQTAIHLMKPGLQTQLFGMGIGSFPSYYFLSTIDQSAIVNYRVSQHDTGAVFGLESPNYLALGYGDFSMTQKISLRTNETYRLSTVLRSANERAALSVKICLRHIIVSERYIADCVKGLTSIAVGNDWRRQIIQFTTTDFRSPGLFYWPPTVQLFAMGRGTHPVVDIAEISIRDSTGREIVRNSMFDQGLNNWFFVRDFGHLAWHTKNIFLHLYFEQGLFGVFAFLLPVLLVMVRQIHGLRGGSLLTFGILPSLAAFLVTGMFGSLIDSPKITFLFYFLVIIGLQKPAFGTRKNQKIDGS